MSTSKAKRFEILKRDHFTCQYCGGMSPDVPLEVVEWTGIYGTKVRTDWTTTCRDCKRGKAALRASASPVPSDHLDPEYRLTRAVIDSPIENRSTIAALALEALRRGFSFRPELSKKLFLLEQEFAEEAKQTQGMPPDEYIRRCGAHAELCERESRAKFNFISDLERGHIQWLLS